MSLTAAMPLKASLKEERSVIRFRWAKGLGANAIQSEMHPVYGDKYFTRQAVHVFGVKSFLMVEKVLTLRYNLIPCCFNCRRQMQ